MRRGLALALLVLATTVSAAYAPVVVINMGTRPAGSYSFNPVAVPTGVIGLAVSIDLSEATEPLPAITITLEGSPDGGTNWIAAGSMSKPAGPKPTRPGGAVQTELNPMFRGGTFWNDLTNANRRLRGTATLGGSMRFALTVTPL